MGHFNARCLKIFALTVLQMSLPHKHINVNDVYMRISDFPIIVFRMDVIIGLCTNVSKSFGD